MLGLVIGCAKKIVKYCEHFKVQNPKNLPLKKKKKLKTTKNIKIEKLAIKNDNREVFLL